MQHCEFLVGLRVSILGAKFDKQLTPLASEIAERDWKTLIARSCYPTYYALEAEVRFSEGAL